MFVITPLILVFLSAFSFSFALPNEFYPSGVPLGGFICLIPFFLALQQARSWKNGVFLGFIFGIAFHASSSWWLANFKDYALWTLGATSVMYGCFYGFWSIVLQQVYTTNSRVKPIIIALLWTIIEWQKSSGYLAFPWGLLPYSVQSVPVLIQIADIGGIYGLSFLLALGNGALSQAIAEKKACIGNILVFFLLLLWTTVYGMLHLANPVPVNKKIPLVLVQHNIDQYSYPGEALESAISLSAKGTAFLKAQGTEPALVIWSETVLTEPYIGNRYFSGHKPVPFLEKNGVPVLLGAPLIFDEDDSSIANGAILIGGGTVISSYKKQKLIPFAETIPFADKKWMKGLMERFAGFSSFWTAGNETAVMEISGLRFGAPICFEDAFALLCRDFVKNGAEILVNLTNDSWSQSISAQVQHLAAARFRSIETRRTLVRSTNSGCTAVIDAQGRTIAELPLFTAAFLAMEAPVYSGRPTVYFLLGNWFPVCSVLIVVWFFAFAKKTPPKRGFLINCFF